MVDLFVIVPMAGNQSDAMMRVVRTFDCCLGALFQPFG